MPWREMAIGELGRVVTGATPQAGDASSWGDAVDFLTPSDQRAGVREAQAARKLSAAGARRLASRLIPAGATCVTCIGATTGKTSLTTRAAVTNQQINSVVPDPAVVHPAFLYYLLTAHGPRIAQAASGSAAPIINKRQFERFRVLVPPLAEQDKVTATLGALDDKIAANERAARTALSLAEALFEEALFEEALFGAGPARTCRLGDIAGLRYGKALPAARRRPGEVPVFGSAGVTGTHDEALVPGPGIVIGRKGTAGAVHWSQRDFFPIDTAFYVVPKGVPYAGDGADADVAVPLEVLFFALRRVRLDLMRSDSAVPGLGRAGALAARVRVPGPVSSLAFLGQARPLFALREALATESAQLALLRGALLPSLVLGIPNGSARSAGISEVSGLWLAPLGMRGLHRDDRHQFSP
jgi:type I restriction enzyme S subunit